MSKVLFVNGPMYGHVNPTLPLVKELVMRGEEVVYFCANEFENDIKKTGAEFRNYPYTKGQVKLSGHSDIFEMLYHFAELNIGIIKNVMEQVKDEKYHYTIYDSLLGGGKQISEILKIPSVSSVTTFPFWGKAKKIHRWPKNKRIKLGIGGVRNLFKISSLSKDFKKLYHIRYPQFTNAMFQKGDLNIVYTSKLFQPLPNSFDNSFKFVGPSLDESLMKGEFPFEEIKSSKYIYISTGSELSMADNFYNICFKAFGNTDTRIVLSVGKNTDVNKFKNAPSNFIIKNYVPQLEVLKNAELFISHGGMNSVSESLNYNVPLVVIPVCTDNPVVANRVEQLGAGICLELEDISAQTLRMAVDKILNDDSYKVKSKEIGDSFKLAGGYKKAADFIFEFKESIK